MKIHPISQWNYLSPGPQMQFASSAPLLDKDNAQFYEDWMLLKDLQRAQLESREPTAARHANTGAPQKPAVDIWLSEEQPQGCWAPTRCSALMKAVLELQQNK